MVNRGPETHRVAGSPCCTFPQCVCKRRKELTMTTRHVRNALVASLLTVGMVTVATTTGRAQDIQTLPEGRITMTGCFTQADVGRKTNMFVLARPIVGTVASVQEPTCAIGANDFMVRVK